MHSNGTSPSIFFLTDLDKRRIEQTLAQLREEAQILSKKTGEGVRIGVQKEGEIGCEGDNTLFHVTAKMGTLQRLLSNAESVRMPPDDPDKVMLGTKVTIDRDDLGRQEWEIVGHSQSDCDQQRTAYDTSLGILLYGKSVGEEALGLIGSKIVNIKIVAIELANGNGKLGH